MTAMLDYQKPETIALAACRLRSLACAAEIMVSDSGLPNEMEAQSIGCYLLGMAYELALEISEAADLASAQNFARNSSNRPD